jgi:hypothetical protein
MVFLFFIGTVFASDSNSVAATSLRSGYFDITNLIDDFGRSISHLSKDSIDGIYLHVEHCWQNPGCDSTEYLRLFIEKRMDSELDDNLWVLTDHTNIDSLNLELKKGNPLTLEKFTNLEFDTAHVQYLLSASDRRGDIEIKWDNTPEDSIELFSPQHFFIYFLYKKNRSITALCGTILSSCYYRIGCFYQNDGSFVFDSLPDPSKMTRIEGCPNDIGSSLRPLNHAFDKRNSLDRKTYKVNGSSATNGSSNIVIQNKKQPKLQLKGNKK